MAILVNNTVHLIIVDGKMFIPRKPVENVDIEKMSTKCIDSLHKVDYTGW